MEAQLTGWSVIRREFGGRDEGKVWIARDADAPRSQQWLWKPRTMTDDGTVPAINDTAEVIASRLARRLGLPAACCRYAVRGGEQGLISRNVTPPGHDLHGGDTYLHEVEGYVRRSPRVDSQGRQKGMLRLDVGYTLEAVEQVLDGVSGPPEAWEHLTGFHVFAGYLVLDALIANTDRHPRNWALLERQADGRRFLAPTFDHGRSLGSGMTDEKRERRDPAAFCRKGKANAFTPRGQGLVDLALEAVARADADLWLDRVSSLDVEDFRETMEAPLDRLSEAAANFIEQVLEQNRRRLCDVDGAEDRSATREPSRP